MKTWTKYFFINIPIATYYFILLFLAPEQNVNNIGILGVVSLLIWNIPNTILHGGISKNEG